LPAETRDYVLSITRRPVEDWIGDAAGETITDGVICFPAAQFGAAMTATGAKQC